MENFVVYTKSYGPDVDVCKRLKESVDKYNIENIPFYVSVPQSDMNLFKNKLGTENYILVPDEDIYQLTTNLDGWRTQQIVKSHFNKLNVTKNYLCLDSDTFFINDFRKNDFMATEDEIYTLMTDAPLQYRISSEICHGKDYYSSCYYRTVRAIRKLFDNEDCKKLYAYGPPPYPWNCKVWEEIQNMFESNGMNMETFFIYLENNTGALSREAVIYGEYLLKYRTIDIYPTSEWFIADGGPFVNEKTYNFFKNKCGEFGSNYLDVNFLKRYYLGLGFQDGRTTREKGLDWNCNSADEMIIELENSNEEYQSNINHHKGMIG
tara:strand:+ start:905 stop:1867 length:963 start_codon:yes stop_codon:yes gene_type:complete